MMRCEFCREPVTEGGPAHLECAMQAAKHNYEAGVLVERERCAKIAEAVEWDNLGKKELGGYGRSSEDYESAAGAWIAKLIRDSVK